MNIYIGENIKRLRTTKDITQEQLADFLNISNVAVSKWERGETYPDISLLPVLAKYFDVTIDTLMGYDAIEIKEKVMEIKNQYWQLRALGLFDKASDLVCDAKQKYYDDYTIMYLYMIDIIGGKIAKKEILIEKKDELINLCDKILCGCNDEKIRLEAINIKAKILYAQGEKQNALELLKSLPDFNGTVGVKSEELFYGYDTWDSQFWITKNLYSLSHDFAIRLVKKIWFGNNDTIETKILNVEKTADNFFNMYDENKEISILLIAQKLYSCLAFWAIAYFANENGIIRIKEKELKSAKMLDELCKHNELLYEMIGDMCNGKPLVKWQLDFLDTAPQKTYQRMRRSVEFNNLLDMYR